jgi:hypothetical protein
MKVEFLERLLGGSSKWAGACIVIMDAQSAVESPGPDTIVSGGVKSYAPRVATGRLNADTVMLLKEEGILLAVEQLLLKDGTGRTLVKKMLAVVDVAHIVGVEFDNIAPLAVLGINDPPPIRDTEYRPGTLVG